MALQLIILDKSNAKYVGTKLEEKLVENYFAVCQRIFLLLRGVGACVCVKKRGKSTLIFL